MIGHVCVHTFVERTGFGSKCWRGEDVLMTYSKNNGFQV